MKLFTLLIFAFILINTEMISQEIRNNDKIGIFYRLNYPYFNLNGAKFGDADTSLVCCANFTSAEISSMGVFNIGLLYNYTLDSKAGILFKLGYELLNSKFTQNKKVYAIINNPDSTNAAAQDTIWVDVNNSLDLSISFINFSTQYSYMVIDGLRINAGLEGKYLLGAKQTSSEKSLDPNVKFKDGTKNDSTIRNYIPNKDVKESMNTFLYGINVSVGYDIPLSKDKKWIFTPELSFYYNMNAPIKQIDWNFMNMGISLAIKYELPAKRLDTCKDGRVLIGDTCLCPENSIWNESKQQCEPIKYIPVLADNDKPNVTSNTASISSKITDTGNDIVFERGFCWNKTGSPTIKDSIKSEKGDWSTGKFSADISNLEPKTEYFIRSYATNSKGTGYGNVKSFTTPDTIICVKPIVLTIAASEITQTSAKLNGNITDIGNCNATERGFCWNMTGSPSINNSKNPETGDFSLGKFSADLTYLTPNSKYYYKAYAINSAGISYGDERSFTTEKPSLKVATNTETLLKQTTVTLNGTISETGNDKVTERGFCWNLTGSPTINDEKSTQTGDFAAGDFSIIVDNLKPKTIYFVKAYAINSVDTAYGKEISITTTEPVTLSKEPINVVQDDKIDPQKPVVEIKKNEPVITLPILVTNQASVPTQNTINLSGKITDTGNDKVKERGFFYNTKGNPTEKDQVSSEKGDFSISEFSKDITGLTSGTKYYFKAFAINSKGTGYGNEISFKTKDSVILTTPVVLTYQVTDTTQTLAKLSGKITDTGNDKVIERGFFYNTKGNPTEKDQVSSEKGDFSISEFSKDITGLTSGTKYYFKAFAINSKGTGYGEERNFTTKVPPPPKIEPLVVAEIKPNELTPTSVKLTSKIGNGIVTELGFCWNKTGEPTVNDEKQSVASSLPNGEFSATIPNLKPETGYYFKAYAINAAGPGYSPTVPIKTPVLTLPEPDAPVGLTVNNITDSSFQLSWSAPLNPGNKPYSYNIEISANSDFSKPVVSKNNLSSSTLNYKVVGLEPETKYYCRLNISKDSLTSPWAETSGTTPEKEKLCDSNMVKNISTNICECDTSKGYYKVKGFEECQKLPDGMQFCIDHFIRKCKIDEPLDKVNCKCDCPPDMIKVGNFCQCDASKGFYFITLENKCVKKPQGYDFCNGVFKKECPKNTSRSDINCECPPVSGYKYDLTGNVVKKCDDNQELVNGNCVPKKPITKKIEKDCSKDDPNMEFINGECQCKEGFYPLAVTGDQKPKCEKDEKLFFDLKPFEQYDCKKINTSKNTLLEVKGNDVFWLSKAPDNFIFEKGKIIKDDPLFQPKTKLFDSKKPPFNFKIDNNELMVCANYNSKNQDVIGLDLWSSTEFKQKMSITAIKGSSNIELQSLLIDDNNIYTLISDDKDIQFINSSIKPNIKNPKISDNNKLKTVNITKYYKAFSDSNFKNLKISSKMDLTPKFIKINEPISGKIPFAAYFNYDAPGEIYLGSKDTILLENKKPYFVIGLIDTSNMSFNLISKVKSRDRAYITDVATDIYGNIIVAGKSGGLGEFRLNSEKSFQLTEGCIEAGFIIKYDKNLNLKWYRVLDSTEASSINSIAVNKHGDIYIAGSYKGQLKIDSIYIGNKNKSKVQRSFIALLDSDGSLKSLIKYNRVVEKETTDPEIGKFEDEALKIKLNNDNMIESVYVLGKYANKFYVKVQDGFDDESSIKQSYYIIRLDLTPSRKK